MYSALPAVISILFLAYGLYVLAAKGATVVTVSFLALCTTTFFWQSMAWVGGFDAIMLVAAFGLCEFIIGA